MTLEDQCVSEFLRLLREMAPGAGLDFKDSEFWSFVFRGTDYEETVWTLGQAVSTVKSCAGQRMKVYISAPMIGSGDPWVLDLCDGEA